MNVEIAYRPLECLTMTELEMLRRMATHYSEIVRKHAYLVGLMSLAMRTGDGPLLALTKEQLAENELECNECFSALRVLRQELLGRAVAKEGEEELQAVA